MCKYLFEPQRIQGQQNQLPNCTQYILTLSWFPQETLEQHPQTIVGVLLLWSVKLQQILSFRYFLIVKLYVFIKLTLINTFNKPDSKRVILNYCSQLGYYKILKTVRISSMRPSQLTANPSLAGHNRTGSEADKINKNKCKGSEHDRNSIVLSKIIFQKNNNKEHQLSQKGSLSSQFIYNSQEAHRSQTEVRPNTNQTLSQLHSIQPDCKGDIGEQSPPAMLPQPNKYELDYRKTSRNLFESYKICPVVDIQRQQENTQLALSVILGHSLKNIKQLDIQTLNFIQNAKGNKNKGKKPSKDKNTNNNHRLERDRQYARKLQQYKPNIYRLLQCGNWQFKKQFNLASKSISLEYFNQLAHDSHRFNTLYGQNTENKELILNQQYLKQKQLNSKFFEQLISRIMSSTNRNQRDSIHDRLFWEGEICKIFLSKFCASFKMGNQISENGSRIQKAKKQFIIYERLGNLLEQKMLAFTCSFQIFLDNRNSQNPFKKQFQQLNQQKQKIAQNYHKFRLNQQKTFSVCKQKHLQQFRKTIIPFFNTTQYSPHPVDNQYQGYIEYKKQLKKQFDKKQQQHLRAKITGQMLYEVEDKIMDCKINKQFWVKCAYNIIKIKKRVDRPLREQSRSQKPQFYYQTTKTTNPNIQIIRKIKNPQQNIYMPTNKSISYTNLGKSRVVQNLPSTRQKFTRLPDLTNISTINPEYNITPQYGLNKNKKNLRQQKKQQLNDYINKLCNKNSTPQPQIHRNTIQSASESINNRSNKYIKYNKYPIKFGDAIEFYSQNPQTCAIVYNTQEINVKQLTLRFMRDRRKYGVNRVIVRVNSSAMSESKEDRNKSMKILQILSCLGANVRVERAMPYRILEQKDNPSIQIIAFTLRQNIQKIWEVYAK